jgi:hypothetical protein
MSEGAAHTIHRLQRELMLEKIENERLRTALREIAAGRIREDFAAGENQVSTLMAARITQIARAALRT